MNIWLGGYGKVNADVARGKEYYGVFLGDDYELDRDNVYQ